MQHSTGGDACRLVVHDVEKTYRVSQEAPVSNNGHIDKHYEEMAEVKQNGILDTEETNEVTVKVPAEGWEKRQNIIDPLMAE